jgi:hypothetical protein
LKIREFEVAKAIGVVCSYDFSDAGLDGWANQFAADMIAGANSPVAIPGAEFSGQTAAETYLP